MTNAVWTEDSNYYIWQGQVRVAKSFDPATQSAVILLGPEGGIANIPALVKGDPGQPATINSTINLTALAYDDPTTDSATFTLTTPATNSTPPEYTLNLALHKGSPGATGSSSILSASDITGTGPDGYSLVKTTVGGVGKVTFAAPRVGGQYWPNTLSNTSGTDGQNRTLASVTVSPAPAFDYRLRVSGQCIIGGTANTRVDLIARISDATSGDIVGRGFGLPGAITDRVSLSSGPPAGSASTVGKISANTGVTVYLRAEQQASTTEAYTTAAATTSFMVEVVPVP
jgi:hypothetical protein